MLNTSVLVRSLKLETLSLFSTWMGDHLGTLGGFPFFKGYLDFLAKNSKKVEFVSFIW